MKVALICNTDSALAVFRAPLIRALVSAGHHVVTISSGGAQIGDLRAMGAQPVTINFSRHSASPLSNIRLLCSILKIIRRERPDVVHAFAHKAVIYGTLAARLAGVPRIVATVTGLGTLFIGEDAKTRLLRRALIQQYRHLLPSRTAILFQNPDDLREMVELGAVDPGRSTVTGGSGIDLAEFALPDNKAIERARAMLAAEIGTDLTGRIVVFFVARGIPEKGIREFYAAAKELGARFPEKYLFCHLGLIDWAASETLSVEDIQALTRSHKVRYLGYKKNIHAYMSACDIVALPSYYREGVPRSLIEALALGKCVITTDLPGCRETVIDGWNGFFCEARNPASVVEAILKANTGFLANVGPRARQLCEERFDVGKLNALTFDLYGIASPGWTDVE